MTGGLELGPDTKDDNVIVDEAEAPRRPIIACELLILQVDMAALWGAILAKSHTFTL